MRVIAAQQAASNRKGSNLKGRTVRKGGGFQARVGVPCEGKTLHMQ